ncbi:copper resistance protein B [Nitrosomonas sp. HPC101]|uniref:copper resistance protein B n=1 Tax=Nitrosomonas sp. HPC101 TaxID=1658667 RepID=UPI0023DC6AC1|nr:copper resistance protein B [Nitrosomonas sp. HPC101]
MRWHQAHQSHAAVQKVEKFTTGQGLNNIELGFRLRYEIRREIAPYIGISYDRSFFRTADFVRECGGQVISDTSIGCSDQVKSDTLLSTFLELMCQLL